MASILILGFIIGFPLFLYGGVYFVNKGVVGFIQRQEALDRTFLRIFLQGADKITLVVLILSLFYHLKEYFKDSFYVQDILFLYVLAYPFLILGFYLFCLSLAILGSQIYFPFSPSANGASLKKMFSFNRGIRIMSISLLIIGSFSLFTFVKNGGMDQRTETWVEYYDNGAVKFKKQFKKDKLDGYTWAYDEKGQIAERQLYKDGIIEERVGFYPNGPIWAKIIFKEGVPVKRTDYDLDGTIRGVEVYNSPNF